MKKLCFTYVDIIIINSYNKIITTYQLFEKKTIKVSSYENNRSLKLNEG